MCLEEAATEARRDCEKLKERAKDDDSMATLDELEQTHTEANEMVASEKQALTEDRDQFSYDMKRIGELSVCTCSDRLGHIFLSPSDKLLRDLVVAMDRSDVEYAEIMKELKTEIFSNRCHQERLREHLWRLEKEEGELKAEMAMPEAEESRARSELEEEMCSNHGSQEKLREELQRLEERLRVVEATARVEELLQDKGDEVSWCVRSNTSSGCHMCVTDTSCTQDYHCTVKDISQWREELDTLHQQAEMSLLIVDTMSGVLA